MLAQLAARARPSVSRGIRAYHERVLDHYSNPRNVGSLDKNSKNVGTGLVGAPACGDVMKLQIEVSPDGIITDASECSHVGDAKPTWQSLVPPILARV